MNVNQVSVGSTTPMITNAPKNSLNLEKHELGTYRSSFGQEQMANQLSSIEELNKTVEEANKIVQTVRKNLKFGVHEESNRVFVEVRDMDTNEVIKEMPPKDFLDMVARIREFVGLLLDERI